MPGPLRLRERKPASMELGTQSTQNSPELGTQSTQSGYPVYPMHKNTGYPVGTQATQSTQKKWKDERAQLNLKISQGLLEAFKAWCAAKGIGQKEAIELALHQLLGTQSSTFSTDERAYIDDIDSKNISIITEALFVEITGRSMTPEDWQSYAELKCQPYAILSGMLLAALRAKNPINSFRYFTNPINEAEEAAKVAGNLKPRYQDLLRRFQQKKKSHRGEA